MACVHRIWKSAAMVFLYIPLIATAESKDTAEHTLSLGSYYSSGDYGRETDTRLSYFPLSYRYQKDAWSAQISVPYLSVDGRGSVLLDGGGVASTEESVRSGLGDTNLTLKYQAPTSIGSQFFIDIVAQVKMPTADERDGLGTGKTDYSLRLDVMRGFGRTTLFGSAGYRLRGESDPLDGPQSGGFGELGFNVKLTSATGIGVLYGYSEAVWRGTDDVHELMPYVNRKLSESWSLMGYAIAGLSDSSPDVAGGMQLSYHW